MSTSSLDGTVDASQDLEACVVVEFGPDSALAEAMLTRLGVAQSRQCFCIPPEALDRGVR